MTIPLLHPLTRLMKRGYDWMLHFADKPYAEGALFGLSFAEASFFPLPPDPLLLAMGAGRPQRAIRYAVVTTVASVLGAMLGYAIGALLFEPIGEPIVAFFDGGYLVVKEIMSSLKGFEGNASVELGHLAGVLGEQARELLPKLELPEMPGADLVREEVAKFSVYFRIKSWYDHNGILALVLAAITPIPFKVFTIASGALSFPLAPFIGASLVGRGLRFGVEGLLLRFFGAPINAWIEKWFDWVAVGFTVLLVGGFLAMKYI